MTAPQRRESPGGAAPAPPTEDGRQERHQEDHPEPPDATPVLDMLVEEARTRIDRQLSNNDGLDVKAAAVLAAVGAVVAIVVAVALTGAKWGPTWPVPLVLSAIAAVAAALALVPRKYHSGPDIRKFYNQHGGRPHADAARFMLSELLAAADHNRGLLRIKLWLTRVALAALFALGPVSALFWRLW